MEIEVLLELIELILTQKDVVGDFVEKLANKKFVTDEGDLLVATKMRQIQIVRFILESGVRPTLESFQYAAEHEFFELCRLFVEFGSREILSTPELEAELITNLSNFHLEHFKNLINRGVDFTNYNEGDDNAVQLASYCGYTEIVCLLLKHGADPTTDDNLAIEYASGGGNLEIIQLLLEYRADPTANNNSAIRSASAMGRANIIQLLLDNGADPTAEDNEAIKSASEWGHLAVVRLLLDNDSIYTVNPVANDNYAIKNASGPNKDEIIALLEHYGASL